MTGLAGASSIFYGEQLLTSEVYPDAIHGFASIPLFEPAAHRLWVEWLDEGRVRKLALVAERPQ